MNSPKKCTKISIGQFTCRLLGANFQTGYNEIKNVLPSKIFYLDPNLNPDNKRIHKLPNTSSMCMWQSGDYLNMLCLWWLSADWCLDYDFTNSWIFAPSLPASQSEDGIPITLDSPGMLSASSVGYVITSLNRAVKDHRLVFWTRFILCILC